MVYCCICIRSIMCVIKQRNRARAKWRSLTCENNVSHAVANPMPTARHVTLMTELARDTAPRDVASNWPQKMMLVVGTAAMAICVMSCGQSTQTGPCIYRLFRFQIWKPKKTIDTRTITKKGECSTPCGDCVLKAILNSKVQVFYFTSCGVLSNMLQIYFVVSRYALWVVCNTSIPPGPWQPIC